MKTPRAARRLAAGFTLIELLTVIAIIGILAAIIIPTVGKVRQSAFKAKSTANLRQLSLAATAYANDNKGQYPGLAARDPDTGDALYTSEPWTKDKTFGSYVGVKKPDWKPGDESIMQSGFPVSPWPNQVGRATIGYNATDMDSPTSPQRVKKALAMRINDIVAPSRLLMFAEAVDYRINYSERAAWTPEYDTGVKTEPQLRGKIAYRVGDKTLISTYGGNVMLISRTDCDDEAYWRNFRTN